jgi:Tol biopolymer transport system component
MNTAPDLGRTVTDWLDGQASSAGSERVLATALERVAESGQERYVTQRLFGDRIGRVPQVRLGLAIAVVALLASVGAVAVGSLLQESRPLPVGPAANGWIVFVGQAEAGPNLDLPNASRTSSDLYFVREGEKPRLVIGALDDQLVQGCAAFSPDGTRLAYLEFDRRAVAATPPPAGPGATATSPAGPGSGAVASNPWKLVVSDVRDDGTLAEPSAQLALDPAPSTCAEWSPDGQRVAYVAAHEDTPDQLWVVALDGSSVPLGPPMNFVTQESNDATTNGAFAWSPDGSTVAALGDQALLLLSADGSGATTLPADGDQIVEWSPDGTTLALVAGRRIRLVGPDGAVVAPAVGGPPDGDGVPIVWSHDGTTILTFDDNLVAYDRQGRTAAVPSVRLPASVAGRSASIAGLSPDGSRLLLNVSGPDADGTLLTVDPRGRGQVTATELFPPTFAYRGSANWQPDFR